MRTGRMDQVVEIFNSAAGSEYRAASREWTKR